MKVNKKFKFHHKRDWIISFLITLAAFIFVCYLLYNLKFSNNENEKNLEKIM